MFSVVHSALTEDEALRATMLLSDTEPFPNIRPAALDEVLAARVVVDVELDDFVSPRAIAVLIAVNPTVLLDEAINRRLNLKQPRSLAELAGERAGGNARLLLGRQTIAHAPRCRLRRSAADAPTC
jgi:hypothetical protein